MCLFIVVFCVSFIVDVPLNLLTFWLIFELNLLVTLKQLDATLKKWLSILEEIIKSLF